MAADQLIVQEIVQTGLTPTFEPANTDGDYFSNDGKTFLVVKNGGASPVTVTIDSKIKCNQGFDHDLEVLVAVSEERWIGPFEVGRFTGSVEATYSGVTDLTVGAFKL
ncbi:unnamed protein product [marine sediment metagenome]|uniref:Uncharacterized protein n=1 Tax=marine sediment metagenome TaxID=412755 RepID=X1E7U4_9ZZZZ